jgi:hypothetical protein
MENNTSESKYLWLWGTVIISALIIVVGWFYAVKYNMAKISEEMGKSGQTSEQAAKEFNDMVAGIGEIIKKKEVTTMVPFDAAQGDTTKEGSIVDEKTIVPVVTETPEVKK